MYQVENKAVVEAIESDSRHFTAVLDFGDFQIEKAQVGTIKPSFGSVQNETPCIGDVVSTQCEIQIIEIPEDINLEGKEFQLYLYAEDLENELSFSGHNKLQVWADYTLESIRNKTLQELDTDYMPSIPKELIPICKLTVLKVVDNIDYYTLTCSDRLHFADKRYHSYLSYPASSNDVVAEIAQKIGATAEIEPAQNYLVSSNGNYLVSSNGNRFITSTWQFTIMKRPVGYTMRQVLSFIAAMRGKFAVCDRQGVIVQRWYSDGETKPLELSQNQYYIDEPSINMRKIKATGMSCKVDEETTLTVGNESGRMMEFECPYMTQDRLNEVFAIVNLDYYPCTFTQRLGDPRYDLWDKFSYRDGFILMLNMDYTYDGGLMLDVDSGGNTDTENEANGRY